LAAQLGSATGFDSAAAASSRRLCAAELEASEGLLARIAAAQDAADLLARQSRLVVLNGRLAALQLAGASTTDAVEVVAAGGDLFRRAADAYGDASAWPEIARASGLGDPWLNGVAELLLPAVDGLRREVGGAF
jgi:hypothetical protein